VLVLAFRIERNIANSNCICIMQWIIWRIFAHYVFTLLLQYLHPLLGMQSRGKIITYASLKNWGSNIFCVLYNDKVFRGRKKIALLIYWGPHGRSPSLRATPAAPTPTTPAQNSNRKWMFWQGKGDSDSERKRERARSRP
jgi:hypothetical protein